MNKYYLILLSTTLFFSQANLAEIDAEVASQLQSHDEMDFQMMDQYKREVARKLSTLWQGGGLGEHLQTEMANEAQAMRSDDSNELQIDLMSALSGYDTESAADAEDALPLSSLIKIFDAKLKNDREYDDKINGFTQMSLFLPENKSENSLSSEELMETLGSDVYFTFVPSVHEPMRAKTDEKGLMLVGNDGTLMWEPVKGKMPKYEVFDVNGNSRMMSEEEIKQVKVFAIGLDEAKNLRAGIPVTNRKLTEAGMDMMVVAAESLNSNDYIQPTPSDVQSESSSEGAFSYGKPSKDMFCNSSSSPCKGLVLEKIKYRDNSEGGLRGSAEMYIVIEGFKKNRNHGQAGRDRNKFYMEGVESNLFYSWNKQIVDYCAYDWIPEERTAWTFMEHDDSILDRVVISIANKAVDIYASKYKEEEIREIAKIVAGGVKGLFSSIWLGITGGEDDLVDYMGQVYFNSYNGISGDRNNVIVSIRPGCFKK